MQYFGKDIDNKRWYLCWWIVRQNYRF